MTDEQQKQLLDYLASLGFGGEKFTAQLQEKLKQNAPNFMVPDKIAFSEEQMSFKLYFVRDQQFDAYRLQHYEATHRSPVLPEHAMINGIDTAALEERMKGQDWEKYFNRQKDAAGTPAIKDMAKTMELLNKLSEGQNFDGIEIQEELMYKYFPAENYYSNGKKDFKIYHERSRDFAPMEHGTCNVNLAYHILSGRLDELYEKLSAIELDQYSGKDLYIELERRLSQNPDSFELKFVRNEPEAFSEIIIPVKKDGNDYDVTYYTANVIPHPPIEHNKFNGIDSAALEQMMQQVDWHDNSQLFIIKEDEEPSFPQNINDIQEQMYRLSQDMAGSDIADRLMLKYWSDADFFEGIIPETAWDEMDKYPRYTEQFPLTIKAVTGVNLLSGRAAKITTGDHDDWLRLDLNTKDRHGLYPVINIRNFPTTELEQMLDRLPILQHNYYPVRNSLLCGDAVTTSLKDERKIILVANPELKTIDVFTADRKPIPVNLRLDPDWKPSVSNEQQKTTEKAQQQEKVHRYKMTRPVKRNKGRGI